MGWSDLLMDGGFPEDPVSVGELGDEPLDAFPEGESLSVMEDYHPEMCLSRDGLSIDIELSEHIYTKYWEHKYHARVFAEAMLRAARRFRAEGWPLDREHVDGDDDVHIFVRITLRLPASVSGLAAAQAAREAFDAIWSRANSILDDAESVLILGKDTGDGLDRLEVIKSHLEERGYFVYLIKQQPDRLGETILQKVLRHALMCKFVIIENTEASGHLYEIPHVVKMAECLSAVLQEQGHGATWMFEDAYFRNLGWTKIAYEPGSLADAVNRACTWAEDQRQRFAEHQLAVLPWFASIPRA